MNIVLLISSDQADATGYSLCVRLGQPDGLLNIVLLITSDQVDADYTLPDNNITNMMWRKKINF